MKWIFVAGCTNSGTWLVHDIIASHPQIDHLAHEGVAYAGDILPAPWSDEHIDVDRVWTQKPEAFCLDENSDLDPKDLLDRWLANRVKGGEQTFMVEKTPSNLTRMRWLQRVVYEQTGDYPLFVVVVRRPLAVCEGIRRRSNGRHSLEAAVRHYEAAYVRAYADARHLERVVVCVYEDVCSHVADTYSGFSQILDISNNFEIGPGHRFYPIEDMNSKSESMLTESEKQLILDSIHVEQCQHRYGIGW